MQKCKVKALGISKERDPIGFTHTVDLRGLGYTRGDPIGFTHTVDLRGLGYTIYIQGGIQ